MVRSGGKAGNLSMIKVNHYRNLGQHLVQLTTAQKPAPQPIATNTDAKSQKQVTLAKGILDYYSREKRVDRFLRDAA
jgi:selenophosphate synthase